MKPGGTPANPPGHERAQTYIISLIRIVFNCGVETAVRSSVSVSERLRLLASDLRFELESKGVSATSICRASGKSSKAALYFTQVFRAKVQR